MYKISVLIQTKQKFSKIPKIKIVKKELRQRSETFHVNSNLKQWDIKEMKENQSVTYLIWIFLGGCIYGDDTWCMQEIGRRLGMRKRMGKRKKGGGGGGEYTIGKT